MAEVPVLRVNQLDARRLDAEISAILRQQLLEGALTWSPDHFAPEIDLLLQTTLWRFTVWIDEPTPGGRLQNIRYARVNQEGRLQPLSRLQRLGFLMLWVVLPWVCSRSEEVWKRIDALEVPLLSRCVRWLRERAVPRAAALHSVFAAVNFVLFLRHGTYSQLRDRLLGIRMVHIDPKARRQVAFEYMNRVMIWNGFSEFLLSVMPLVNLSRLRRTIMRRLLPKATSHMEAARADLYCGFCGSSPMMLPMRTNCEHVFCYYCVASELMEQPKALACPHCGDRIYKMRYMQ